jgi:hypothetical protein
VTKISGHRQKPLSGVQTSLFGGAQRGRDGLQAGDDGADADDQCSGKQKQ